MTAIMPHQSEHRFSTSEQAIDYLANMLITNYKSPMRQSLRSHGFSVTDEISVYLTCKGLYTRYLLAKSTVILESIRPQNNQDPETIALNLSRECFRSDDLAFAKHIFLFGRAAVKAGRTYTQAYHHYRIIREKLLENQTNRDEAFHSSKIQESADSPLIQFSFLPIEITKMAHLRSLHLYLNLFQTLPSLSELVHLTRLDLSYNQFQTLPPLSDLINLTHLNISSNPLITAPSFETLNRLTALTMSGNQLQTIPDSVYNLITLEELVLSINSITTIPESIGNLTRLRILYLSNNNLEDMPEALVKLTALESLNLSANQIKSLPKALGNLRAMKHLDVSYSPIDKLPKSIEAMTQLQTLSIARCKLQESSHSLLRKLKDYGTEILTYDYRAANSFHPPHWS